MATNDPGRIAARTARNYRALVADLADEVLELCESIAQRDDRKPYACMHISSALYEVIFEYGVIPERAQFIMANTEQEPRADLYETMIEAHHMGAADMTLSETLEDVNPGVFMRAYAETALYQDIAQYIDEVIAAEAP